MIDKTLNVYLQDSLLLKVMFVLLFNLLRKPLKSCKNTHWFMLIVWEKLFQMYCLYFHIFNLYSSEQLRSIQFQQSCYLNIVFDIYFSSIIRIHVESENKICAQYFQTLLSLFLEFNLPLILKTLSLLIIISAKFFSKHFFLS